MSIKRLVLTVIAILVVATVTLAATPVRPAQAATCVLEHVVVRGNTLYSLARLYGTTVAELQSINGMAAETRIWVGQRLCIRLSYKDTSMVRYTVQRGDTLYSISRRTGVSVEIIMRVNNLTNANKIYVGQVLLIPTAAA